MTREAQKTPFYQVEVGDSTGKKLIALPYQIHRLIDKIEIKELLIEGGCIGGQFNITFNEGSREPYSTSKPVNTSVSYPINTSGAGGLTNRPGMLSDLRYIKDGGEVTFSAISPTETGIILDDLPSAAELGSAVASSILETASGKSPKLVVIDDKTTSKKALKYLFQQNNQIKITWGYVEDLQNRRSVRGYISAIDFDYPENDNPKVVVTCVETGMRFDQVSGIFGTSFFDKSTVGATLEGDPVVNFEDLSVKEIIETFSEDAGMADPIVSDEFDAIKLDKYGVQRIPAGMSPQQFFAELAKKYDAYYKVAIDPSTGADTIIFLSKREFNSKLVMDNKQILSYKTPGSFVKSVKLRAEFNALPGNAQVGVTAAGEVTGVASKSNVQVGIVDAQADVQDIDPAGNNAIQAAKGSAKALNTKFTVGSVQYNPEVNDVAAVTRQVSSKANCQLSNIIMVSLVTIGFCKFRPGAWYVGGVGQRYSGVYYFREISHTIDANGGYVCRLEGSNQSDYGGTGKSADGFSKTQAGNEQVSTGLFKVESPQALLNSSVSNATGGTASDKYNKMQESN